MSSRWYYQLLTEEFGPVTVEQLHDMLQTGTLDESDLVRNEAGDDWVPLSDLKSSAMTEAAASPSDVTTDIDDLSELAFEFEDSGPTARRAAYAAEGPSPELTAPVSSAPAPSIQAAAGNQAPAEHWYCESLGQILGPMPFDELIAIAESGALDGNDRVRCGERGIWKTADCLPKVMRAVAIGTSIIPNEAQVSSTTQRRLGDAAAAQLAHPKAELSERAAEQTLKAPAGLPEIPVPAPKAADRKPTALVAESQAEPPRKRRHKGPRGEDELLDEIFDDVFSDESPPARPAAAVAPVAASASVPVAPPRMTPPSPVSSGASSSTSARAAHASPMAAKSSAKSSSTKSSRSFEVDPKSIMILVGVLLLASAGYAFWHFSGSLSVLSGGGSFDKAGAIKTLDDAIARVKSIAADPSESEWEELVKKTSPEINAMYKSVHEQAGTTDDGVTCLEAIKAVKRILGTPLDNKQLINTNLADFDKQMAKLKE